MIYDKAAGAWRDAETPLVWDAEAQAYKNSTGLIWDEQAGAWSERWNGRHYIYKNGIFHNSGSFIWSRGDNSAPIVSVNNNSSAGYIQVSYSNAQYWGTSVNVIFSQQIPAAAEKMSIKIEHGTAARVYCFILLLKKSYDLNYSTSERVKCVSAESDASQKENLINNGQVELDVSGLAAGYAWLAVAAGTTGGSLYPNATGENLQLRIKEVFYQ